MPFINTRITAVSRAVRKSFIVKSDLYINDQWYATLTANNEHKIRTIALILKEIDPRLHVGFVIYKVSLKWPDGRIENI